MAGIFSDEDLGMGDGSRQLLQRVERFGWRTTKHGGRLHRPAIKTEQASANPIRDSCEWTRPTLTLAIPLSGRADLWPRMASFLERQTWPHDQLRLVLLDTSQVPIFSRTVREWLAQCDYVDVRYLHERVGLAGLADRPRRTAAGDVALAMTRIYNLLAREVTTAFVWFLEDDVFPPTDVCERLLESINNRTASVTAAYQSRLGAGVVAWDRFGSRLQGGTGLEQVAGNGFGCVLVRGEIVRETVFRCSANLPAYDSQFYSDLEHNGWIAKIDRSLRCEHAVDRAPELASDGLPLVSNRVLNLG